MASNKIPIDELNSLRDWVRWTDNAFSEAELFFGHGTDNSFDEALELVLATVHLDHNIPESYLEALVSPKEKELLQKRVIDRIETRFPMAYITGRAYFCGLEFIVDNNVLVPRSPIAELIVNKFQPWLGGSSAKSILDLCTGSGCIGIACAYAFEDAFVDLADVSFDALDIAKQNINKHQLSNRVNTIESDVFKSIPNKKYDLIVSNPPYVSIEEMEELPVEYWHEPALGLEAGEDGMDIVSQILSTASDHLSDKGIIIIEVGASAELLMNKYKKIPFMWVDFEYGGDGVFMLTKQDLENYRAEF